jgi:OmpA-OmpF porin, OOP family
MFRILILSAVVLFAGCAKQLKKIPIVTDIPAVAKVPPVMPQAIARKAAPEATGGRATLATVVYFGFDSDQATGAAQSELTNLAGNVKLDRVKLIGGACPIGDEGYNQRLGLRRAEAVKKIIGGGAVSSVGETVLISTDPAKFADNRRCEIWVE